MPPGLKAFPGTGFDRFMSALIDIVITFIAAMVSAAFVHFGAHSEKPRPAHPPVEPAHYQIVSDDVAASASPAEPATDETKTHQTRIVIEQDTKTRDAHGKRMTKSEIRIRQDRTQTRLDVR